MLEVVEDQEKPSVADALSQTVCGPNRLSGRFEHELWVAQPSERDPIDAVGISVRAFRGCLERKPGLAGPRRAGQRQQSRAALEHRCNLPQLLLSPQGGCRTKRKLRPLQALQRR